MAIENISQDIADLLATKDFDVKYTDGQGQDASPEEAKTFAFDWVAGSGKNYGTVVIVIGDDNDLQLFFGDNLGKTMENPQDKLDWFGSERETGFLPELKNFATQHRYTFSPKDINQLKHTMQGMAAIKEGLFEGYYGTRRISYVGEQTEARLVIKHNRMIGEDDKRYRYVESLFIETVDGERFKLPFTKLSGGRAMLEHVKQGGRPYDIRGQHINEIVSEMAVLSRFNRASQQRVFEGVTQELVETVHHYYSELRESLQHMATGRGYNQYFESWTPADIGDETALVEDLKTMFIEQTLDARIEAALPTLAKIQQRGNAMKEAQIFENWANSIMEGTWALPDTPEAQAKLNELMSKELIVGPDATNAKEQLYDVIGDDQLFDILSDLAEQDPRANCWDDTDVQARLQELGIQMNTTPAADQQQPVAPAAGEPAPGTVPAQGVAEDQLAELSPATLSSYGRKAAGQAGWAHGVASALKGPEGDPYAKFQQKRAAGVKQAVGKGANVNMGNVEPYDWAKQGGYGDATNPAIRKRGMAEDQLDELSPGTLSNYVNRAVDDVADRSHKTGFQKGARVAFNAVAGGLPKSGRFEKDSKIDNRKVGISRAIGRMEENTELNAMLKYAGVPLRESVLTDSTGHTLEHILQRFSREVADFEAGAELDNDLFDALYDYYFDDMPYGVKKARTGDPHEWISQRLADDLGITESNSGMLMPEADPIATVEAMPDLSAPVVEGSCNMTTEGEYCPEHGLAECGMYEDNEIVQNTRKLTDGWKGAVAGGAAGAMAGDLAGGALGSKIGQALGGAAGAAGGPIGSAAGQIAGNMAGEKIGQFVGGALGGAAGGVAGDKLGDKVNEVSTGDMAKSAMKAATQGLGGSIKSPDRLAQVFSEKTDDPINYNAAITGAYYESKSDTALLARIKSLALLK